MRRRETEIGNKLVDPEAVVARLSDEDRRIAGMTPFLARNIQCFFPNSEAFFSSASARLFFFSSLYAFARY